jgi:cysteine desulfurase
MRQARTYLDWNATAPLRAQARSAMLAALDLVGNPSSVHEEGRAARAIVEGAREDVARLAGARPAEVVFTSGASEANNWVLRSPWARIVCARIEHDSVLAPATAASVPFVEIDVDADGVADPDAIAEDAFGADPARTLVTLQMANNETGVIQPVAELAARGAARGCHVHTDAVQAAGRMPLRFADMAIDTMALSAHKIGGPKGIGALIVRDANRLAPLIAGGGQERRRRAGTENVAAIAGFGAAATAAVTELAGVDAIAVLRDRLEREVRQITPQAVVIGAAAARLPNTSLIAMPGMAAETLVIKLDLAGFAISAGAACSSGKVGISTVLQAMGLPDAVARGAVRISLGAQTQAADIKRFVDAWRSICATGAGKTENKLQAMAGRTRAGVVAAREGV